MLRKVDLLLRGKEVAFTCLVSYEKGQGCDFRVRYAIFYVHAALERGLVASKLHCLLASALNQHHCQVFWILISPCDLEPEVDALLCGHSKV